MAVTSLNSVRLLLPGMRHNQRVQVRCHHAHKERTDVVYLANQAHLTAVVGPKAEMIASTMRLARRRLAVGVGLVATLIAVTGCEPHANFFITNATDQTLTIDGRTQLPGESPEPPNPTDPHLFLQPGEKRGLDIGLSKDSCSNLTFSAHNQAGQLVGQDPSPICAGAHGHGRTWVIKAK